MVRGRLAQPDSVKANPHSKVMLAPLLQSGAIKPSHRAAQWHMEVTQGKIAKEKFRKFFDVQLKKHYGEFAVRTARSQKGNRMSQFFICHIFTNVYLGASSETRPKIVGVEGSNEDEEGDDDVDSIDADGEYDCILQSAGELEESLATSGVWRPLYLLSRYKDTDSRDDRIALAVLLPSGVHEHPDGIQVEIENGSVVRVVVPWPVVLTDTHRLLKNFLEGAGVARIDRTDPMVGGFNDALRALHPERNAKREAVARIHLPFSVKPDASRWLCSYEGSGTKVLIIKMEGPTSRFARTNLLTTLTATQAPVNHEARSTSA